MKWKTKLYSSGDERVVTKFLFLPKRIGEDTRWLEWAKIRQEVIVGMGYLTTRDVEFIDG